MRQEQQADRANYNRWRMKLGLKPVSRSAHRRAQAYRDFLARKAAADPATGAGSGPDPGETTGETPDPVGE